ncbi:hypothetical protein HHI36_021999 [Cryptolaemus montrouzieri]|uniref:Apolipophorins n=1 Tax=Cryptolaemus montrouzieri TaxID=559131 RepID=A0ABD2MZ85_9CUCU
MAQNSPITVGFALVLIFVLQLAHAIDQCKTGCNGAAGPLKLTPGTTYKYDYDGKINILLSSAEGQQTGTEVKATVLLTQQADCSQVLRLQNVQVIGPDGKKRQGIPDIDKPVVLNNNNGALSDFICSTPGDTQNSLNVKRAIASLFQIADDKPTEIDVFGQCPTHIQKHIDGDIITVTKNKNLNKCAFRESVTNKYITSSFDINSDIQSSPILNSNFDSKHRIKAGVLDSANVVENYLFVPFSVGQNGAKANIESKLTLIGTSKENPTVKCTVPKSIIFENPHPVNILKSNVNIILNKMKEITTNLGNNVDDRTAVLFVDLVKLLRVCKKADILSVYNQVKSGVGFPDKEGSKKIFLDSILLAGNGDTIEVAIELLKNKELGPFEEKQLYLGLSRARHATENSVKTATDLLNRPNLPREAFLGVGALAGRYCANHNCENVDVINKLVQKLLSKLGDLKAANRKEESDMIYVLKGLTNVGYLNDAILSKLVSLAEDRKQPIRLRVATLEAFLAAPCKDKLRDSALKTLKDIQQDSEIRIKAYLVLARCPNDKIGNAIKALLEQEQSNQVGGFIATHIKNIRTTTNPDKALARAHLGFIHTPHRFPIDIRKYSFNSELSYSFDALGIGSNAEHNVIYSQNSWLPRSTNLNLTAEIFGQRFNFLEIAARQENLDKVLEHYLGPQGLLRKATVQQSWDQAVKPVEKLFKNLKEKVDKSLRARRDVSKAQIDAVNKKVQIKTNELDKNLDLDLSIKNFGSEIVFMNSFDITEKLSPQGIIDNFVNKLNEGLDKLKNFEKTFRSNILLLDAELSYPTSLGFPLRLVLDGASTVQIKTQGSIDVRELLSKSQDKDFNLKLSLVPSATVTVSGTLSLDTPLLDAGLKVDSTLHTSTGAEVLVNTFKEGYGLDAKFVVPVQKQSLVDLKHVILFVTKENGALVEKNHLKFSQNKDFSICIDQLASFIGLEFCADINGPNLSGKNVPILPFPLSGSARTTVRVERGDINTFHYRREFFSQKEGKVGVEATLETLDSKNNKGVSLSVGGYISPDKYIHASLKSPIKSAEAEARLINNDKEKVIAVSIKDETKAYSAKAGLKVAGNADKTIYNPIFEYTTPENKSPQTPPLHVEGKVIAEKNGNDVKYTFDNVKLVIPGQKSIAVSGFIGTEGSAFYSDLTATDGKLSGSVKGRLQAQQNLLAVQAEIKNTVNPNLNFNIKGEFKKLNEAGLASSNLQLTHGADLNSKTNVLTLVNSVSRKGDKEFSTKNKFSYPLWKVDAKFDLEKTPKSLDYDTYLQYSNAKIGSELKLKTHAKSEGDYQLEFDIYNAKNKVEVKSSRQIIGPDDSKIDHSLSVNGKKLEIAGKVKHHFKPNDINSGADLVIKAPNSKAPWKLNEVLKVNSREIDFHLKLLSGSNPLIDALLKANKAGNANGHVKVNFKDILTVNGQLKAQKGVGSGDILIEAKSLKKATKAETSFTLHDPTYNLDVTLYPVFNEDKNKKVVFSTKNKASDASLDSSSTLDLLGSKFALNVKGLVGSPTNGKTSIEADATFPGEQYIAGKVERDVSSKDGIWNSDNYVSLEHRVNKAKPGRKITVKAVAKNTNLEAGIADITVNLVADNSAGSNLNAEATFKRQKNDDRVIVDYNSKVTGSPLKNPHVTSFHSERKDLIGKYTFKSSFDPKAAIQIQGTYDVQPKVGQASEDINVDLLIPVEILSNIKVSRAYAIRQPRENSPASLEYTYAVQTVSSNPQLNIDTKHIVKAQGNKNSGSGSYHAEVNKPFKSALDASANYNADLEKKTGNVNSNFKVILPQNKVIQGSSSIIRVSKNEYKLESSLDLPTETFKSNKLSVHTKRTDDNDVSSQLDLITDGKKYSLNSDLSLNDRQPSVDFKLVYPDGKVSEFSANVKRPSSARLTANLKIACQRRDFLLQGGIDVNSESLNNFYVQITANSPKLNVNDILLKIGNEGSNDGKNLKILVTSAGKNVVSGSATVSSREEQGKFIIEGSGNFKVQDQDKTGNFKYIRTSLTSEKNGEVGEEISFDASLGNKALDAELKLTNKEFRYLNSYCEESKQCAHVEIDVKTLFEDISKYQNQIEVTIDLRVLGVPNEFGLKAVTHRDKWLLDHTVDVHFENSANKYQYSVYIHPKEAGISLTTPQRIISLEANSNLPTSDIKNGGKASGEIAFYTDKKNKPNSKSSLRGYVNVDVQKHIVSGELTLNIVGQPKPLSIRYSKVVPKLELKSTGSQELVLDIFAKPEQKIVATQTYSSEVAKDTYRVQGENNVVVKSQGLGIDVNYKESFTLDPKAFTATYEQSASLALGNSKYDSIIKAALSTKEAYLLIKHLNQVLLEAKSDINLQKGLININTHTSGLGLKPIESTLEIKNYNTLKFTQYLKNDPNTKLLVTAAFIPGQIADARAEYQTGGAKKELFHSSIKLDDKNFLHPDAAVQTNNVKEFSTKVKDIVAEQAKETSAKLTEGNQKLNADLRNFAQTAKETVPDTSKTQQFYKSELDKFRTELATDKTLQDIGEVLKTAFDAVASTIAKVVDTVGEVVERVLVSLNSAFTEISKTIQTHLLPKLKEIADEIVAVATQVIDKVSEVILAYFAKVAELVEAIQPQLKALSATFSEIAEDIGRFLVKTYESIKAAVLEQYKHLKDELKASPIIAELKAQYEDFLKNGLPSQEVLLNTLKAFTGALKEVVVIQELQNVVDLVEQYLEKKITNKPVDDAAELEKITTSFVAAIKKLSVDLSEETLPEIFRNLKVPSLNWDLLKRLPTSGGGLKISALNYLLNEDIKPILRFYLRLLTVPQDFLLPRPLVAAVTGSEVFTFDEKMYHFPGTCSYLFARDAVNGNFSIVADYQNKRLSSITLTDKSGSITLKADKVLLNHAETDYPVNKGGLHAFYTSRYTYMKSSAGVKIRCHLGMLGCAIEVSGYYHGQLRGLLGNANNEEFDDFILPNGVVEITPAQFVQSYVVGSGCAPAEIKEHEAKPDPKCDKIFSWDSPLRVCYPIIPHNKYKRACERSAAAGFADAYTTFSLHYAYMCWRNNIPVAIHSDHSEPCKNSLVPHNADDQFTVKIPGKAADVLFIVNANKHNELLYKDYVQPLFNELVNAYKAKGISDVEFRVVAFQGENEHPVQVTVHGNPSIRGQAPNIKFVDGRKPQKLVTGCKELDNIISWFRNVIHDLQVTVGILSFEANEYPFRAEALKTTVIINNEPCDPSMIIPHQIKSLLQPKNDVNMNLIVPTKSLKVKDGKTTKDVIGFNSENVITLTEGKSKPTGSSGLLKDLSYSDLCLDYGLSTGATVFPSENLLVNKNSKQQIVQIIAKNIVDQAISREGEIECTCGYTISNPFAPYNRCQAINIKEK